MSSYPPLVTIRCLVYNHGPFLRDCLEGFVMQKTMFPFEAVVHDDASTDNSAQIIKEYADKYPNIIKAIFETENQYSKHDGSLRKIMDEACTGKYVAFCEGDDYWIDPYKLQRQIDYMERNQKCSMSFHAANIIENGIVTRVSKHSDRETDFSTSRIIAMGGSYCPTTSIVLRREVFDEYPKFRRMADVGDYPMQIMSALKGEVHYFPEIMGCYRVHSGSWTSTIQPDKNIEHLHNRMQWLKELDEYTGMVFRSAIYFSIVDSAMSLFRYNCISKKELMDVFRNVNILCLDVPFKSKKIFIKQYLSVVLP